MHPINNPIISKYTGSRRGKSPVTSSIEFIKSQKSTKSFPRHHGARKEGDEEE
jgi:hypothetical protein